MDAVEVDYHVVGGVAVGGEGFARQGGGFFGHGRGRACGCGCACGYAFVPGYSFFFGLTVGDFIPKKVLENKLIIYSIAARIVISL